MLHQRSSKAVSHGPQSGVVTEDIREPTKKMVDGTVPSFKGIPLKYISLFTLTIQNSALILIMHYSRVMPGFRDQRYFASTAVLLNELLKMIICLILNDKDQRRKLGKEYSIKRAFVSTYNRDAWKLTIPAVLYTVSTPFRSPPLERLLIGIF